ncbi:MAG: TolC family protein [bacterium]
MKKFILFLILTTILRINSQNIKTLNLDDAIKIAYQNRPSLKAFKFSTQANKENEKIAISGYLPQISLNSVENFSTGSKGLQNSTTINASQLIYSFSGPKQQQKIAKKGTEIAKLSERSHEDLIRYQVEAAFLQTWLLQEKNKLIKTLNVSAKENIKKSEHQDELNLLGKNDWLKSASTYANNMSNIYQYSDELYSAQNQLEYLLGDNYKQNDQTPRLIWNIKQPIKVKSLMYYYNKALQNRKEIKLKQKELEQYQETQTYYKNNYLPEISLSGQAARYDQTASNNVGINLKWNLFDGSANYRQSQMANANKLKVMQEKETYVQKIKYEVQKAYHELIQYKKQLAAKNIEIRQAKNELDLNKLKFNIGDISSVDFEISLYNWENTKYSWLTTKINTTLKQKELFFTCGYPENI